LLALADDPQGVMAAGVAEIIDINSAGLGNTYGVQGEETR
jgi:hypothetical protein